MFGSENEMDLIWEVEQDKIMTFFHFVFSSIFLIIENIPQSLFTTKIKPFITKLTRLTGSSPFHVSTLG